MKAIETALEDGDSETALEVLKSVGILKDPKAQKSQVEMQESDELAKAIAETRNEQKLLEDTVDATIVRSDGRSSLAGLLEASNSGNDETSKAPNAQSGNSVERGLEESSPKA